MDFVKDLSYLQLFWYGQAAFVGLATLFYLLTGGFWDKTYGERSTDDKIGIFQFRKRVGQYVTIGFLWTLYIIWTAIAAYCFSSPPRESVQHLLQFSTVPRGNTVDATCVILGSCVYLLHLIRRMYDCLKVSIFSRRQLLDPLHLVLTYGFCIAVGLSLIADGPPLRRADACFSFSSLSPFHLVSVVVFLWASKLHHQTHQVLARLRKNKAGHIVTTGYKMPKGDWFDLVSSPHYFAEILIYVSVGLALGPGAVTWWALTAYVTANQFFLAYNTHKYYEKKFEDYPKDRKMLIPYVL